MTGRLRAIIVLPAVAALAMVPLQRAHALGELHHVVTSSAAGAFSLASAKSVAALYADGNDWPGVGRAVASFSMDVAAVTGQTPAIVHSVTSGQASLVIIGTIGRSALIDRLIAERKLDVSAVQNHWEMSVTEVVNDPLPGVQRALVIAGADKRGTIFAIYDLSEQIGVSPWAWWADVPIAHHSELFVEPGRYLQPVPRVKYRGIFLNDEAPSLSGWAREKFGGFNHTFYEHVFELLLRLKANFLWPAMWGSAFNEDDPLNPQLADEYGIVMGTSHHEPMMRSQQEWKRHGTGPWDYTTHAAELDTFWREGVRRNKNYEELTTIGMRGNGDMAMSATTNTQLLERIVADQRNILAEEVNPDVTKVPQVWALYKEVQSYYESGMRVPDDVTLLWCDDNWGNIRRLPTATERKRPGGAGIYYHFDYVGDPRSYKWLNTYSITKVWEQMNLAVEYGADRMWIVNVGDLKPMEFPIEFFLSVARTPERWNANTLQDYTVEWATREFGAEHANEIADLVTAYTKFNGRRKPEQLDPNTWSLTVDHEADRIDRDWRELTSRAERMNELLPANARAAFFELVLYPLKASAIVNEMYIAAGRNRLYAIQGRASANAYADETRRLFAADAELSDEYNHKLLNGKWNHMMDQTHIGYTFWNEPPVNAMPAVRQVTPLSHALMRVFPESPVLIFDSANRQTRSVDLANLGKQPFRFSATASEPWVRLSMPGGEVATDARLEVSIDWLKVPEGSNKASITLKQQRENSDPVVVPLEALRPALPIHGLVENDGIVTMDAEHTSSMSAVHGVAWQRLPGFGETLSGMESFPVTAPSTPEAGDRACMSYSFYVFHAGDRTLQSILAPTLSFTPGRGLRYSIVLDDRDPITVDAWASDTNEDWSKTVSDGVHKVSTPLAGVAAGQHTLRFCRVDAGVVVERILIIHENAAASYLGPPESANVSP